MQKLQGFGLFWCENHRDSTLIMRNSKDPTWIWCNSANFVQMKLETIIPGIRLFVGKEAFSDFFCLSDGASSGVRTCSSWSPWRHWYEKPLAFGVQQKWRHWKCTWFQMRNVRPKIHNGGKIWPKLAEFLLFRRRSGPIGRRSARIIFSCPPGGRG